MNDGWHIAVMAYLPVITVLCIWIARMKEVAAKREVIAGPKQETLTLKLFIFAGFLMVFGGFAEYFLRGLHGRWLPYLGGLALALASFWLRRSAIAALGRFWSLHVEMRQGHEFVTSGPFSRARHPVYFSMILEHVGTALILGAWITFGGVMLLFIPTLVWRLRMEEAALIRQFGPAYEEYRRQTPLLIPSLTRRT